MSLPPELSAGVIEQRLNQGLEPPKDQAVFRILGTKALPDKNGYKQFRIAITDTPEGQRGGARFNRILLTTKEDPDSNLGLILPEKNDIVDFCHPDNKILKPENIDGFIWSIRRYKILNPRPTPSTPSSTSGLNGRSSPSGSSPVRKKAKESSPQVTPSMPSSSSAPSGTHSAARRALFQSDSSAAVTHKIKDLNPYSNRYTICARVTNKGELKEINKAHWSGKVFNMTLQDDSGDIQASGFNDMASKFHSSVQEGQVYFLSNAQVKSIKNKRFNTTSHNYELGLNQNTVIKECRKGQNVPSVLYSFTKIAEISNKSVQDVVDVIGVCSDMEDVREVTTKNGRQVKKRDITLIDDSENGGCKITVTLWGEKSESFDAVDNVMAIKSAVVGEFNGKNLSCSFSSRYEINPDGTECQRLKNWYRTYRPPPQPSSTSSPQKTWRSNNNADFFVSFGELKMDLSDQPKYFNVEAYVNSINSENIAYKACSKDSCNKKLDEVGSGYFCRKCNLEMDEVKYRYLVRGTAADATDYIWFTAFDEAARGLLGIEAAELMKLKGTKEYNKILDEVLHSCYQFRVMCKYETYNDENRPKCILMSAEKVDHSEKRRMERMREDLRTAQGQ